MNLVICVFLLALMAVASEQFNISSLNALIGNSDEKRCWLRTYGRGAGKPLTTCRNNEERNGALCYPTCKSGFYGSGPLCWQQCPAGGFMDIGAGCQKPQSYGRGGGYVIWDGWRCNRDNSQGCEQWGALWYPKCRAGFYAAGCCVCSPNCPNGMQDTGAHCTKQSYGRGAGTPLICEAGLQQDAALCYTPCSANYKGVGPVCWGQCPAGFNQCGAMCLEESICTSYLMEFLQPAADAIVAIASKDGMGVAQAGIEIVKNLIYPICD